MTYPEKAAYPQRVGRPVPHTVKFRHAEDEKECASELCPEPYRTILADSKYARVQRIAAGRRAVTECFHPKCYDYEFEQGHGAELAG